MELSNKEVDLQRNKLLQTPINLKSDYLPMLHAQAAELRKDTMLASSSLYEQCQKAYEHKEQELNDHLQHIENTSGVNQRALYRMQHLPILPASERKHLPRPESVLRAS